MKYIFIGIFFFICYQGKTQSINEYEKFLTSDSIQSWIVDSFAVKGFAAYVQEFSTRGAVLTFKLVDKSVVFNSSNKANDIRKWQFIKEGGSISLKIDNIKPYEIDFIKKNGVIYMRLHDADIPEKSFYVCEYYFRK